MHIAPYKGIHTSVGYNRTVKDHNRRPRCAVQNRWRPARALAAIYFFGVADFWSNIWTWYGLEAQARRQQSANQTLNGR